MKAGAWLVLGGAVAGFLGVLGLHRPAAVRRADPGPGAGRQPGPHRGRRPGRQAAVTGPVVGYGYGELAARVAIRHDRITGVSVPVLKTAEQFSQELADRYIPVLRQEVLAAQSAHIQAVSGATYTSEAYAQSVQAALDKAHFK